MQKWELIEEQFPFLRIALLGGTSRRPAFSPTKAKPLPNVKRLCSIHYGEQG